HARAASMIGYSLLGPFGGPRGVSPAPGAGGSSTNRSCTSHRTSSSPISRAGRHERMPLVPDAAAVALALDWACEVVSRSTGAFDRGRKRIYAREGVPHLWMVDMGPRTLEVFRLERGRWFVASTHDLDMTRW